MVPSYSLATPQLRLRPFALIDAPTVQRLAGAKQVAEMTLLIPHPYGDGMAEKWILSQQTEAEQGLALAFAICLRGTGELCGAIGLKLTCAFQHAELGYWLGVPYWGRGYATEAAREVLRFGFETQRLHRIFAHHFLRNPASGRVLTKIGMRYEGRLREHVCRDGRYEDLECYGLLRREWTDAIALESAGGNAV